MNRAALDLLLGDVRVAPDRPYQLYPAKRAERDYELPLGIDLRGYRVLSASWVDTKPQVHDAFRFLGTTFSQWRLGEAAQHRQVQDELSECHLDDVALLLEEHGQVASAARVRRLLEIALEEDDDGEKEPQTESLRSLARFLLLESHGLPRPTLALGPLGLFTAEWRVDPSGGMILQFISDDEIQFTGVANIREDDPPYQKINCVFPREKAIESLFTFKKDLAIYGADGADSRL